MISLLDADPDLGEALPEDEVERARRQATTRTIRLEPGEWDATNAIEHDSTTAASSSPTACSPARSR